MKTNVVGFITAGICIILLAAGTVRAQNVTIDTAVTHSGNWYPSPIGADDYYTLITSTGSVEITTDNDVYLGRNGSNNTLTVEGDLFLSNSSAVQILRIGGWHDAGNSSSDNEAWVKGGHVTGFSMRVGATRGPEANPNTGNTLKVTNGGIVEDGGYLFLGADQYCGEGELLISGTGSRVSVAGPFSLANTSNSPGNVARVEDNGTLGIDTYAYVGRSSSGNEMYVHSGGNVTIGEFLRMGNFTGGADSLLEVDGANSTVTVAQDLTIGVAAANNTVRVQNGGSMNLGNSLYLGTDGSSNKMYVHNGTVNVTGLTRLGHESGSLNNLLEVKGSDAVFDLSSYIHLGRQGSGNEIHVLDGATATVGGVVGVGRLSLSENNLLWVSGANSTFTMNGTSTLTVTHADAAGNANELRIEDQGRVYAYDVDVGDNGTVTLNNGTLEVGVSVYVRSGGLLKGSGTVDGNADVYGVLSPGNSVGTLDFTGTLTLKDGSEVQIGLGAGETSDLVKAGTLTIEEGSTLVLSLLGGYELVGGETFTILDSSSITGTFDSIDASELGLTGGWYVDDSDLYTLGTVAVIPEPHTMGLILIGLGAVALRRRMRFSEQ